MERAIIYTGKLRDGIQTQESYQIQIGTKYVGTLYDGSYERRNAFFEQASNVFARRIIEANTPLEIGVINGARINPATGKEEKIENLELGLIKLLTEKVSLKLANDPTIEVLPVTPPLH